MNIDLTKNNYGCWYEDINGNKIDVDDVVNDPRLSEEDYLTCHHCFPLEVNEEISSYCWHPETALEKLVCKFKPIYRYLLHKNRKNKTFRHMVTMHTSIGRGSEDVILAMANSGDYTLSEAIWVYANSCERCMNVLAYKYLNGKDGYEEYSEEWKKCNTECNFCKGEKYKEYCENYDKTIML